MGAVPAGLPRLRARLPLGGRRSRPAVGTRVRPGRRVLLRFDRALELDPDRMPLQLHARRVLLRALRRKGSTPFRALCSAARAWGSTALVRPEVLPFSALIPGAARRCSLKGFKKRGAALALGGLHLLIALTWAARNAIVLHRFVPASAPSAASSRYLGLRLPLEHQPIDIGPYHSAPDGLDELELATPDYVAPFQELRARGCALARRVKAYIFNLLTVYHHPVPPAVRLGTYANLLAPFWLIGLGLGADAARVDAAGDPRRRPQRHVRVPGRPSLAQLSLRLFAVPDPARGAPEPGSCGNASENRSSRARPRAGPPSTSRSGSVRAPRARRSWR